MVEWKELGSLGRFENIGTDKKIIEGEDIVTLLNYVDVYRHKYIDSSVPQMQVSASKKKIEDCTVEKGDIFVTPSSETVDDIGHSSVITDTIPNAVYSYHIMRYRLYEKNMLLSYYINYAFDTDIVKKQILKKAQGLTRFGLSKDKFASITIPIPSLEEQTRIVGILDTFTSAIDNLKEQIAQRRKQYEYYRDQLLDLEGKPGVVMKTLGEICDITAGGDVPKGNFNAEKTDDYSIPIISNGIGDKAIYGYTNIIKINRPSVTISARGTIGYAEYRDYPFYPIIRLITASPKNTETKVKYLYYLLSKQKYNVSKSGIPQLTVPNIKVIQIPVPSLQEQQRIVSILDTFEASIQNLEEQLKLREKQYEYYRNKLLTFE